MGIGVIGQTARLGRHLCTCAGFLIVVAGAPVSLAAADRCDHAWTQPDVVAALADIQSSVDPCGQSGEIESVVQAFRRCAEKAYTICVNRESERNSIDRASADDGDRVYITWNPGLRTELQVGCAGDPYRPVLRDPHASLLHELAHAVQDCAGLDPNAYELEAVRVENIYRRAHGLCQRTAYGTQPLPPQMIMACEPGHCSCTSTAPNPASDTLQQAAAVRPVLNAADGGAEAPASNR